MPMSDVHSQSPQIIPSLDGICAISVLIVVVSHSGLGALIPGGLGVTIFFFLSGYLITTLMLAENERTGKINILNVTNHQAESMCRFGRFRGDTCRIHIGAHYSWGLSCWGRPWATQSRRWQPMTLPRLVLRSHQGIMKQITSQLPSLLSGVTFSSDSTQLPSIRGGHGQQATDICRIKAGGNLTWHGKAAARVEVRPGNNPLALRENTERAEMIQMQTANVTQILETASSGTRGLYHGGDVNGRIDVLWNGPTAGVSRQPARNGVPSGTW
jgi:hypothetical protein